MANHYTARKQTKWLVVSLVPDVCKTPMGSAIVPVPYPVTAQLKEATGVAKTVRLNVRLRHWSKEDDLLHENEYSYEQWEELRQQHPTLELPKFEKPHTASTNGNGNTIGKVVGETGASPVSASEANPPVDTGTKILDSVQMGLDAVGLIPGIGEFADLANAGISALRGDWEGAVMSLVAAIPFVGWFGTAAKAGKRGANMMDAASAAAKRADSAPKKPVAGKGNNKDGGKVKGGGRDCTLRKYSKGCPGGKTPHHVVPDRVFRKINGDRVIPGISHRDGLCICVDGRSPRKRGPNPNEHGKIHALYDLAEGYLGAKGTPSGTATLGEIEAIAVGAAAAVTGCNPIAMAARIRTYHQEKGLLITDRFRADPTGSISRELEKIKIDPSAARKGAGGL